MLTLLGCNLRESPVALLLLVPSTTKWTYNNKIQKKADKDAKKQSLVLWFFPVPFSICSMGTLDAVRRRITLLKSIPKLSNSNNQNKENPISHTSPTNYFLNKTNYKHSVCWISWRIFRRARNEDFHKQKFTEQRELKERERLIGFWFSEQDRQFFFITPSVQVLRLEDHAVAVEYQSL